MSFVIVLCILSHVLCNVSCAASLMSRGSCQSGRRPAVLPTLLRKNWMSLSVTGALCAVPFIQKPENSTHAYLVRRASSLVRDSANAYLSQTTSALLDSFSGYIMAVNRLVTIHKRYVASMSKLTSAEQDAIWQVILRQRQEVTARKNDCKLFESCWVTAINLSKLAAEVAVNAGADQASVTGQDSIQLTESQVENARQQVLEADRQLKDSKAEDSERPQNALSTAMED
uniref:Direct IAP-binding protein with low pI n=1 Tax=Cyprinus carpio TaxID=7962 RepID=A0A8C2B154_CYPCA